MPVRPATTHHFTVDVEEYFQVLSLSPYIARSEWDSIPSRLEPSIELLLELLAQYGATGTFFTLGWLSAKHRAVVRKIAAAGHEIASHGWGHERVTTLTPDEFRESVRSSKHELEDCSGQQVAGYRAPNFSIVRGGEWALDILLEEGYTYDSSLFPIARPGYGYAGGLRDTHEVRRASGTLAEFPPSTLGRRPFLIPASGGAYFRLFPYGFVRAALRSCESRGTQGMFYIHPWELDVDQPRLAVPLRTRIRHYGGLDTTVPKLRRLLTEFRFQSIARTLAFSGNGAGADSLASSTSAR